MHFTVAIGTGLADHTDLAISRATWQVLEVIGFQSVGVVTVALLTQKRLGDHQQALVIGSVRRVAIAAVVYHRFVLVDEGPSLLGVT